MRSATLAQVVARSEDSTVDKVRPEGSITSAVARSKVRSMERSRAAQAAYTDWRRWRTRAAGCDAVQRQVDRHNTKPLSQTSLPPEQVLAVAGIRAEDHTGSRRLTHQRRAPTPRSHADHTGICRSRWHRHGLKRVTKCGRVKRKRRACQYR